MEHIYIYDKLPDDLEENGCSLMDWLDPPEISRIINQQYSFYGNYFIKGINADLIKKGSWIKAQWSDLTWQYFKITTINKTMESISFSALHLGYEANRNFIQLSYTSNGNGKQIMASLKENLMFKQPFLFESDVASYHQFTAKEVNVIDAIVGSNNGNQNLVGVAGAELDMDNYVLTLKERIGEENGYRIDLGINLASIKETVDDLSVVNSLYLIGGVPEDSNYNDEQEPITYKYLEVSGVTDENRRIGKRENSECTIEAELKKWGQSLFDNDRIHEPVVSHEIDMVTLENTIEYQELYHEIAKLHFGDTVYCDIDYMGIKEVKERMVECVWLPTLRKYKSVILGNSLGMYTSSVNTSVNQVAKKLESKSTELQNAIINASNWITGTTEGYVRFRPKDAPREILIMDKPKASEAKKVWRWNMGGLGYSSTGVDGDYGLAMTQDGAIVANFITVGELMGILIKGCEFQTVDDNFMIKIKNGTIQFYDVKTNKQLGNVSAMRNSSGDVIGFGLNQAPGYSLSLGSTVPGTNDTITVLEIPKESTGAGDKTLLRTWRDWEHHGDLTVKGTLSCTRLIVNGNEITGGGSGGGVTPPELTTEQEKNAWQIWQFFKNKGWTEEAIAGMLGNMQSESGIMPDIDEISGGGGYGLVQWTPKSKLVNWCNEKGLDYRTLDAQCQRIQWEVENNVQWFANPQRPELTDISFVQFTQLTDVKLAADYFIAFYEHPADPFQPIRQTQAQAWFDRLKNLGGGEATDGWKNPVRTPYVITQEYDPIHGGIDVASIGAEKVPIYAVRSGTVTSIVHNHPTGGNYLVIDHGDGYWSYYGHFDSISATQGQRVTNADTLGRMGATGEATGVHLHFEVWEGSQWNRINPRDVISF